MQVSLLRGDSLDSTVDYRDNLPVNMYAVMREIKGAKGYMNQFYGLTKFADGLGVDRGGVLVSRVGFGGHYRVSGRSLIMISSDGSIENLGVINGSSQVSFAYSFDNLAIVADGRLYYYNRNSGLRQIKDPLVSSPIDIVWADGVFILTDGEAVYHSDIVDEENFRALDFSDATFRPDPSLGLGINEDNELLVFGAFTIEPFRNVGNEDFIYRRIESKFLKLGVVGTHARKEMDGNWYVVGRRKETSVGFYKVRSGSAKSLASREIEKILSEYNEEQLSTITIDAFIKDSVKMVILHLPDKVILFNETIAESFGVDNAFTILKSDALGDTPYRAKNFIFDGEANKWLCGDKYNENIGYLDNTKATHYDDIAEWILYTPLLPLEAQSITKIELNTITGFSPDNDATVAVSKTQDGYTFSKEQWNLYGKNLIRGQRFIMRRWGYVRDDIGFKLRGASRSRMNFSFLDVEV